MRKFSKLMRDEHDNIFFGVLSGIALHLNLNVIFIRIAFLFAFLAFSRYGLGFEFSLIYLISTLIIPNYNSDYDSSSLTDTDSGCETE
tara:strand:- start:258 stop:521 length:264 start_codon:yes stop_codon:yes gene_type:complete